MTACSPSSSALNPLLQTGPLPALGQIEARHFVPAVEHEIAQARLALAVLLEDATPPTFANTVLPLQRLFARLNDIACILGCLYNAMATDDILRAQVEVSGRIDAFSKSVFQNRLLAARFKALEVPQDPEDTHLHTLTAHAFEAEGAFLDDFGQQRVQQIDARLIELCTGFEENLQKGAQALAIVFQDPALLEGLPPAVTSAMRAAAAEAGHTEGWLFVPERLLVDSLLECAVHPDFRARIAFAMESVGTVPPHDNAPLIAEILQLRHERALLLGYPHYAAYVLARTMAGSLERAEKLLDDVATALLPRLERNLEAISLFAARHGATLPLAPCDSPYWASRTRAQLYGMDAEALRAYFPLEAIRQGFFECAGKLFGIRFAPSSAYPLYHPDVQTYDVRNLADDSLAGVLYMDMFARPHKQGGAWMQTLQEQAEGRPVLVTFNMNLLKPEDAATPLLLSLDEAETFFHEGGHALHGLLGTAVRHASLQGPAASPDFIEFHSMIMENWVREAPSLQAFARHYLTGEALPPALLEAKQKSTNFYAEKELLKIVQNSRRDFYFHTVAPADYQGPGQAHAAADLAQPCMAHVRAYSLTRFGHLFSGYAASYYGYLWASVLQASGFAHFRRHGLFHPATAARLNALYRSGSGRNSNLLFEDFNHGPAHVRDLLQSLED